jgi:acyl-CoA synthetase (AMP-forming)/AMP-acid ligase II
MESRLAYLSDYLELNAKNQPQAVALRTSTRTLTWQDFYSDVVRAGRNLQQQLDATVPETIGILLPNSWEFAVAYYAVLHAGHRALPYDPTFKRLQLETISTRVKARLTITSDTLKAELPDKTPYITTAQLLSPTPKGKPRFIREPSDRQIATLLFTSGTTGVPKLSAYTHANHLWNLDTISTLWQWSKDDRLLLSLPLSHWHGLVLGLEGSVYNGTPLYLDERLDARSTLERLAAGEFTLFFHVPVGYLRLVSESPGQDYDLSKVRLFVSGSSYMPPALWQQFKRRYHHEILERYGASETGMITSNYLDSRVPGSVGYPLEGVELRLESDGELSMRSPGLFPGYHENLEATNAKMSADGWWRTGDIGHFEADGRVRLKSRIQEKIKKSGYLIYPRDVEWSALNHPKIKDIVVIGITGEGDIDGRIAYVVAAETTEADIREFARTNMPRAWRPDIVLMLDEIPKTSSGKPKLAELKKRLATLSA